MFWLGVTAFDPNVSEILWQSRWHGHVLAALHVFTIGFITMVMCGALLQILCVLTGKIIPGLSFTAPAIQLLLILGVVSFWGAHGGLFSPWLTRVLSSSAALNVLLAILLLILPSLLIVIPAAVRKSAIRGAAIAVAALLVAALLGITLMPGVAPEAWGVSRHLTNMHLMWVLAGWVGVLIVSVSAQVVPRFFLTPSFPGLIAAGLPIWIVLNLIVYSVGLLAVEPMLMSIAKWGILLAYGLFSIQLLQRLRCRKRDTDVISLVFWQYAAVSFLIFLFGQFIVSQEVLGAETVAKFEMSLMVLLIFSVVLSVIIAMLLRIVPFLSYMHMQRFCHGDSGAIARLPKASSIFNKTLVRWLLWLHPCMSIVLILMIFLPRLTLFAGILVLVQHSLLFWMVYRVVAMIKIAEGRVQQNE